MAVPNMTLRSDCTGRSIAAVEHFGPVGCGEVNHALGSGEAIHLDGDPDGQAGLEEVVSPVTR